MGQDITQTLVEQIAQAHQEARPLAIHGGGTKGFLGHGLVGEAVDITGHQGGCELPACRIGHDRARGYTTG